MASTHLLQRTVAELFSGEYQFLTREENREKVKLSIQSTLYILGSLKTVPFAVEQQTLERYSLRFQRLYHRLCLIRKHNGVFASLKKGDGNRESIREVNWRA